MLKNYISVIGL